MTHPVLTGLALAAGLSLVPMPTGAQQQHDHAGHGPVLGEVHFPVSCTPEAQAAFDEGMKLQHSFWYQAADEVFRQVLERDPGCAMALWGRALAVQDNPFIVPGMPLLRQARAFLEEARRIGPKTEREAGFIEALSLLHAGDDPAGHPARRVQYAEAMERLHARFPDDPEVAIYTALALAVAASPADKTYARQLRAAAILEREFERQPQHPGVAHYLIHAYDLPALAERGLPAAERYSRIAADAPHALHMPSHIYTRVGRWEESIEANSRSAATARAREEFRDEIHALDYLVYAYLQTGQPGAARRVLDDLARFANWSPPAPIPAAYGLAAMQARYVLERGAWEEAAALDTRLFNALQVDAITHFARAMGAARAGRPDAAAADIEALRAAAAALQGRDAYWQEQVEIQRIAAEGWVAFARGERDQGLTLLREAAEREGRTEKHPVTPGPLAPAREQVAEMLLLMDRPAEAQREFEAVQQTEPRRFRAVYGAGRSAELAGDREAARRYYANLLEIAAKAEMPRADLTAARNWLDRN
ncbi:lipopolysaccharide assembly protein LapB [Siccirubricoccus sp. G192]|uniref:tetratricopeptide repeat protein n=1 Tax=Siccirubricoccus sp. G192 TaxID=2849651 RepID=UPI001C2C6ED5|nr:hypothetical protein [Siccirubricoccus sp. G192]MBV1798225.1 hypothetical protein [Siccirubricoccus sp. G192]